MNCILTYGEGFNLYKPFIYLFYNSIHKKVFHSYGNTKLFRGGKLKKKEFNEMVSAFNKKKKNVKIQKLVNYYIIQITSYLFLKKKMWQMAL